ncbi:MAG: universal stress protein [Terrimesophilobacter sp.]
MSDGNAVVVGIVPNQPDRVLLTAANLAAKFDGELVCAHVDVERYTIEASADGTVIAFPVDPDVAELVREEFDPSLAKHVRAVLADTNVRWTLRELAGEPANELSRLADEVDAALIVVGSRQPGLRAGVREFFSGSVAANLAHRQGRPIVVVPLSPIPDGGVLPWEQG